MQRNDVATVIIESVVSLNPTGTDTASLGESTTLYGEDGLFDSMGMVGLLVEVEQRLDETWGLDITLGDDRAMSRSRSPFRTIGTLTDYIEELALEHA